ncbi:MAG: type II toxin-antitoxin system HicB family antitoxin [Rhodospirillaceae bacterium]|nr:type II toxin-antitoxin system HicB family antitoxin [Rhodospirillaceae bacterium]
MQHPYHIDLAWSDEDKAWIARVPDLQGCTAHGETAEDAAREIQTAIQLWLEVAKEDGDPIPEPRYNPEKLRKKAAA